MQEIIIVGTGPSALASMLEFSKHNIKPLVIDVGFKSDEQIEQKENLYSLRENIQTTNFLLGRNLEYFSNENQNIPAKLKSPLFKFVTKNPNFFSINNSNIITSYAKGGLANAWGNGLMRLSKDEFSKLPISLDDLLPFYIDLEKEIGISGRNDDLVDFFGKSDILQQPLQRSKKVNTIFQKYQIKKEILNKRGIFLGTPRLGISNNNFGSREKFNYDNLEFWQPNHGSFYSPLMTFDRLLNSKKISYESNLFVDSWRKVTNGYEVITHDVTSKKVRKFKTKKLLLGAGPLNTTRIVLKSNNDYLSKLSFADNPSIQVPIFFPKFIGDSIETDNFGLTQLNLFFKSKILNNNIIGSILELSSPLRSEFISNLPLGFRDNINFIKYILPSMMVCQYFLPSIKALNAEISLLENGDINIIKSVNFISKGLIKESIGVLKSLGLVTLGSKSVITSNSGGIHYGGTLPMKENPSSFYETTNMGELFESKGVFILDGSCFGEIPSTNYSLSVMANSMRISKNIALKI